MKWNNAFVEKREKNIFAAVSFDAPSLRHFVRRFTNSFKIKTQQTARDLKKARPFGKQSHFTIITFKTGTFKHVCFDLPRKLKIFFPPKSCFWRLQFAAVFLRLGHGQLWHTSKMFQVNSFNNLLRCLILLGKVTLFAIQTV